MSGSQEAPEAAEVIETLGPSVGVADRLAADIQAGRFSAGSWLKQIDLQNRYAANRSEVRKALVSLATKRLIQYEPNRGYYVHHEDDALSDEIRDLRVMLETAAADYIVAKATVADIASLRQLAEQFLKLLPTGTIMDIYEANLAFHTALLVASGNRALVELVRDLRLRTPPAPASQWSTRARIEQSGQEHLEMVDALEARNAEKLKAIISLHIQQ
ncbi:GntR family transcriptional regulator [Roseibium sp. CAU 1637]|uniref:GntR family transcriptional regulator n=1 Tax=Roseibium limicola TaxID=2816037 RepID=A0A939EK78_9HYPH|nr:GntR family transcriptional regulator [Roseibium limicola]